MPFWFLPKEVGSEGRGLCRRRSLWDYQGPTTWAATGEVNGLAAIGNANAACGTCTGRYDDTNVVRSSVGVGLIWASPFGPLRFDYAVPITKGKYDACRSSSSAAEHRSEFRLARPDRDGWNGAADIFQATAFVDAGRYRRVDKAHLVDPSRGGQQVRGLASLDEAGPMHLTFFDNLKYADQLASTKAGACLVSARFEASVPAHVAVLRAAQPFRAFVQDRARAARRRAAPAILVRHRRDRAVRHHRSDARIWKTA